MKNTLTKMVIAGTAIASLVIAIPAIGATSWDTTGSYEVEFQLLGDPTPYTHELVLAQDGSDTLSGAGGYPVAGPPYSYTWHLTSGTVVGSTIHMTAVYDTGAVGTTMHMMGTIQSNGSMIGTWNDNYGGVREGTWTTVYGNATDNDSDNDGVLNGADVCDDTDTTEDGSWDVSWGKNRWEVRNNDAGALTWYQNKVGKKGVTSPTEGQSIGYTHGCNGHQIIAMLNAQLGSVMNGHLKYGLSSGVIAEFALDLNDGVLDGKYFLETVVVSANDADGVSSLATLLAGENYTLKVSGTANAGDGISFDADYSFRTPTSVTWTDAVSTYEYLGDTLLDLKVNGGFVNWDNDSAYNPDHTYWYNLTGAGTPASFLINDVYYPNNTGSLTVDIYATI